MPNYDRFWIGPPQTGLQENLQSWLIQDDAYAELNNAYVFRGRLRKRFGGTLLFDSTAPPAAGFEQLASRLRIQVGTTAAVTGNFGPAVMPGAKFGVGQMFSIGTTIFTVNVTGNPAALLTTGAATGTYDTTTGSLTITGNNENPLTPVYFYPADPVMGFTVYEQGSINDDPTYAFDTQFAYQYIGGGWDRLGTAVWTGTNSEFFWGNSWRGATGDTNVLYVSNFNVADVIKYWNGAAWANLNPAFNAAGDTIETARVVIAFKDRLVLLNTVENIAAADTSFVNRCRFSQNGSPLAADAWREDIPGKGGFLDAPTKEAIITASILKDRLMVYFERSTWELVYTANEILPFRWQKINTELGAESTFSIVNFDKAVLGVGDTGVHACNGANVERIDEKIPNQVFRIHNENEGVVRVHGVRDFKNEMVYWTFPSQFNEPIFPTRVLVYNYANGSWSFNDDSITAFGHFRNPTDLTWATWVTPWESSTFEWGSGRNQALFKNIIAGNQEGYTFNVDSEISRNTPSLQITNITPATSTINAINHNLETGDFVLLENIQGTGGITDLNDENYKITRTDANNFTLDGTTVTGVYTGGGTVTRVSRIDILTKQYNFYNNPKGFNIHIPRVEFYVDRTEGGQLTVDFFTSSANLSLVEEGQTTGAILGNNILETNAYLTEPYEFFQERLWRAVYFQADGDLVQLRLYHTDDQMLDKFITSNDFQLHSFICYALKGRDR